MDSPFPFLVTAAIVGGLVYQVGFRYEHWVGGAHHDITYERDNLTGETHVIRPGEKIDFFSRLFGHHQIAKKHREEEEERDLERAKTVAEADASKEAYAFSMLETSDEKGKTTEPVPPVPREAGAEKPKTYTIKDGLDLNGDGRIEQVIQNKTANDGLLDISVVSGGRELFYSRGTRLQILPAKHGGWSDLALTVKENEKVVYHFNPDLEGYEAE